jgi:hypothetical protein
MTTIPTKAGTGYLASEFNRKNAFIQARDVGDLKGRLIGSRQWDAVFHPLIVNPAFRDGLKLPADGFKLRDREHGGTHLSKPKRHAVLCGDR